MNNWPKHGETRNGERYDRPSMAWVSSEEWQRRQWDREDRIFAKKASQGQVCAPQIVSDGLAFHGVRSMKDGKLYDSKSALRRHYRESGVVEVGNDSSISREKVTGPQKRFEDPKHDQKIDAALGRAWSRAGLPA
jgi:hypothetical protein